MVVILVILMISSDDDDDDIHDDLGVGVECEGGDIDDTDDIW